MLEWLQEWFYSQCNGNWEHDFGITIKTLDNPGWDITIELFDTGVLLREKEYELIQLKDGGWYGYKVENGVFNAAGDPKKLNFLISIFQKLVEEERK